MPRSNPAATFEIPHPSGDEPKITSVLLHREITGRERKRGQVWNPAEWYDEQSSGYVRRLEVEPGDNLKDWILKTFGSGRYRLHWYAGNKMVGISGDQLLADEEYPTQPLKAGGPPHPEVHRSPAMPTSGNGAPPAGPWNSPFFMFAELQKQQEHVRAEMRLEYEERMRRLHAEDEERRRAREDEERRRRDREEEDRERRARDEQRRHELELERIKAEHAASLERMRLDHASAVERMRSRSDGSELVRAVDRRMDKMREELEEDFALSKQDRSALGEFFEELRASGPALKEIAVAVVTAVQQRKAQQAQQQQQSTNAGKTAGAA